MRYLVISDIHANLAALETVLADAPALAHTRLLVLGDLVGYGGDPNAVVARIRALAPHAIIRGNHDKVGAGVESADGFNAAAQRAIRWTRETLTPDHRAWLAALPAGPLAVDGLIEICHGTPFDEDAYVFDDDDARRAIDAASRALCLFGHTHMQAGYRMDGTQCREVTARADRPLAVTIEPGARYLVNPGSVGQPRDGDPRAAYAVVDTDRAAVTIHRVAYPIALAQERILAAGLPDVLARRLGVGR